MSFVSVRLLTVHRATSRQFSFLFTYLLRAELHLASFRFRSPTYRAPSYYSQSVPFAPYSERSVGRNREYVRTIERR